MKNCEVFIDISKAFDKKREKYIVQLMIITDSTCSCSGFHKNYVCKYLVLHAVRSNNVSIQLSAHTNVFQDAPKRGRPSIVSKALQEDTPLNKSKGSQTPVKSTKTKIATK